MLWWLLPAAAAAALLLGRLLRPGPPPRCEVYRRPGPLYLPKLAAVWLLLTGRRLCASGRPGYGVRSGSVAQIERPLPLADNPLAADAVLVQGAAADGCWLVAAAARRPSRVVNAILVVSVPATGTLLLPHHPDTTLAGGQHEHGAEGLRITPEVALRRWRVHYRGPMRRCRDGATVDVSMDLTYRSQLDCFDFDADMAVAAVAGAMAREPWSRQWFRRLRDAHQTHYEQIGTTSGTVTVDGVPHQLSVTGMRDHSYATSRDWRLLHRYGLHTLVLQDGTRAQVGVVCQPCTFSHLELGYVYGPDGRLEPLQWCDLQLWQQGENGRPPRHYGFSFAAGNRVYRALVRVRESHTVYIGPQWEARVLERVCSYTVNGVDGCGVSEWYYRHDGGPPRQLAS